MKRLISIIFLAALSMPLACNHYSTQEAYEVCSDLVAPPDAEGSTELLDACVSCYENCGDDCEHPRADTFVCPDQVEEAGGGGGA